MDVFNKKKRSDIMSKIRSKNTKPEKEFARSLSAIVYPMGLRYKLHYKKIPGNPDVVFVAKKIAIFIDGDFWHGYNYKNNGQKLPKKYWKPKIEGNMARDKAVNRELKKLGWKVVRIWEHEIKKDKHKVIKKVLEKLN